MVSLPKKVTLEQRPRDEEASHVDTVGKSLLGRETSKRDQQAFQAEVEMCSACLKKKGTLLWLEQSAQEGSSWR